MSSSGEFYPPAINGHTGCASLPIPSPSRCWCGGMTAFMWERIALCKDHAPIYAMVKVRDAILPPLNHARAMQAAFVRE
jgi:hypothetical protein